MCLLHDHVDSCTYSISFRRLSVIQITYKSTVFDVCNMSNTCFICISISVTCQLYLHTYIV